MNVLTWVVKLLSGCILQAIYTIAQNSLSPSLWTFFYYFKRIHWLLTLKCCLNWTDVLIVAVFNVRYFRKKCVIVVLHATQWVDSVCSITIGTWSLLQLLTACHAQSRSRDFSEIVGTLRNKRLTDYQLTVSWGFITIKRVT